MKRPGTRLRAFAKRICSAAAMEQLIDPAIADLQHEHEDAVRRGLKWRARSVLVAGYSAFWKVAAVAAVRHPTDERGAVDERSVSRTVAFSVGAIVGLT